MVTCSERGSSRTWRAWACIGVAATALCVGGLSCTPPGNPAEAAKLRDNDHVLAVGDPSVTVIEYSDFQCPFCRAFELEVFPTIKAEYIDTGRVRWVYRHFPLTYLHPYAKRAAEATECAADQGRFWEYHEVAFTNNSALTDDDLKNYAVQLGLDANAFNACLDGGTKSARVHRFRDSGRHWRHAVIPDQWTAPRRRRHAGIVSRSPRRRARRRLSRQANGGRSTGRRLDRHDAPERICRAGASRSLPNGRSVSLLKRPRRTRGPTRGSPASAQTRTPRQRHARDPCRCPPTPPTAGRRSGSR